MHGWLDKLRELLRSGILDGDEEGLTEEALLYRSRRAYAHECGHAVVAWLSPAVAAVNGISFRRDGDRAASTTLTMILTHRDYLTENTLVCLGGVAGEALVWRRVKSGGFGNDLPHALRALEAFLKTSTVEVLERRWDGMLSDVGMDVAGMFAKRPPPDLSAALNLCYRRTKRLLQDNRAGFDRLVALAERQGDLSHDDIASQFGPRLWAPIGRR